MGNKRNTKIINWQSLQEGDQELDWLSQKNLFREASELLSWDGMKISYGQQTKILVHIENIYPLLVSI